jgi:hypothetical protein
MRIFRTLSFIYVATLLAQRTNELCQGAKRVIPIYSSMANW